jgi:hypothetical protein
MSNKTYSNYRKCTQFPFLTYRQRFPKINLVYQIPTNQYS